MNERIFIKFLATIGRDTKNNVQYFRDVAVNPWNPVLIFLFLDSCLLVIL